MAENNYILTIDEGTTSVRSIIWNSDGRQISSNQETIAQIYPHPGWVEQDSAEIWRSTLKTVFNCVRLAGIAIDDLSCIGITNQRETTILWDRRTGENIHNAIVWQDRRTADMVERMKYEHGDILRERTGLQPDSYFSAPKVKWILENSPETMERARRGEICFGTVDSFLIWKLSGGKVHATDYSNASRTMFFDIHKLDWDLEIMEILGIPKEIVLPEAKPSSSFYGCTDEDVLGASIPITGDAGDQQAALFGEACFEEGMVKATYGTGSFVLMNTGERLCSSKNLLTTVAWGLEEGRANYALEGSVFASGAAVQWLRDGIHIIKDSAETEELASSIKDNAGVYFVPAFVGLGAPHWDQYARGLIVGITRGTGVAHICRAVLESIAYQVEEIIEIMRSDSSTEVGQLRVDGGASRNNFLMQFQSDITGVEVVRPKIVETTSIGAAYLAGLGFGTWKDLSELRSMWRSERIFRPSMREEEREKLLACWKEAVKRSLGWAKVLL
ncbi:MAG: glycerol kinase GlpK [Thermoproteota archaeon]